MDIEKVPIGVWIRKIIARNVCQGGKSFIDMVFAWVVNDVFGNRLLITKDALVVFKCCQVAVNHLSMISYSDLNVSNFIKVFAIVIIITANLRAVAILFSTL